ncbi:MAG: hypothetical protein EHM45_22550 [Desulfobacteraceae bacterium]|nr:MAG: hypothetical protein EHM45_22550 [Desulfobacteraceae bacterium]
MEFFKRKAEKSYDAIYEAHSSSEAAAAYSDCKEAMHEALRIAYQLGLKEEAAHLHKRLEHFKAVFRRQFSDS